MNYKCYIIGLIYWHPPNGELKEFWKRIPLSFWMLGFGTNIDLDIRALIIDLRMNL